MSISAKASYRPVEDCDIRDALVSLREKWLVRRFPASPREKGLLRRQMIDELLRHKPADPMEFFTMVPWDLIERTDWAQIGDGLSIVLAEMNRLLGRQTAPQLRLVR